MAEIIVRVVDEDFPDEPFLEFATQDEVDEGAELATPENTTGHELAEFLDRDAENGNHHAFVGKHDYLYYKMREVLNDEEAADKMIWALAQDGGLHDG